jgi:tetratricopeptide (TPR) repeat protein
VGLALLLIALLTLPLPVGATTATDGYGKFVAQQSSKAKAASRKRDFDAAEEAWRAVLEIDPVSVVALEGVVDAANGRGDEDAEAIALRELIAVVRAAVDLGDTSLVRDLARLEKRQGEIDPFSGEGVELLDAFRLSLTELGQLYLDEGMHAAALICWSRVASMVPEGSEEANAALVAIERCLQEGGDYVAVIDVPRREVGGKDAAWILAHDKKTAKWSRAGQIETRHYRVRTNAGYRMLMGAAEAMESVHAFYREIWGIVPDPPRGKPDPALRDITVPRIDLNIYREREEYLKRSGAPEWSGGVFKGSEVATFDYSGGGNGESWRQSLTTLFHEASHQFMSVAVGNVPSFINEGVACLFEGIEILPNGSIRRDLPVMRYLNTLASKIEDGTVPPLRDAMDPKYPNRPEFYAPRWGLVYYLRMYVDDQGHYVYRALLEDYIYEFKRGAPGNLDEHFTEWFLVPTERPGIETFDDFEADWKQWILDLKAEVGAKSKRLDEFKKKARLAGLKNEHATALRFYERILDIDPDELEAIWGVAGTCADLEQVDRAVYMYRRFLELSEEEDKRRAKATKALGELDPFSTEWDGAHRSLVGGMAGLALRYDREEMPLMAMRVGYDVLELDPYEASARSLIKRLERETGRSVIRWERLFNGFDLDGWWSPGGEGPFYVDDAVLVSDYGRVFDPDADTGEAEGVSLYRNLFLDRQVRGDWSMEARIRTQDDWEIAGICFGAQDADHFEGIVLRKTGAGGKHNVDFGSFDKGWSFRGDGSYKATYDPTSEDGVLLRVDVRNREVFVTINGEPLPVVVDKKNRDSIKYPAGALRGDIGLLSSRGVTRFTDLRLLANRAR